MAFLTPVFFTRIFTRIASYWHGGARSAGEISILNINMFASILKKTIIEAFTSLRFASLCNYWPTFKSFARGAFTAPVQARFDNSPTRRVGDPTPRLAELGSRFSIQYLLELEAKIGIARKVV
jgi:hypothetical protein